jgi:2,3-bisphosphoglycerate-independent phosphoglycerate mutase
VVVHVGAPDEAAHVGDADGKVAALEALDAELVAPLWEAVTARTGRLAVCPDHGTDPATGEHDGAPVPAVCAGAGVAADAPRGARMTERAAAACPVTVPGPWGEWETGGAAHVAGPAPRAGSAAAGLVARSGA